MEKESSKIETHEIRSLLFKHYEGDRYICADEVGDLPCGANRRMDFVACDCWWSGGFKISAYEIKVSKADLRHDLEDPTKHNIFFKYIDTFSLIAPDYVLDAEYKAMIPPKWGIVSVKRVKDKNGEEVLIMRNVRKPLALNDDPEQQRTFNRSFAASILRRCANRLAASHQKDVYESYKKGYQEGATHQGGIDYKAQWEKEVAETRWLKEFAWSCGLFTSDKKKSLEIAEYVKAAKNMMGDWACIDWAFKSLLDNVNDLKKSYDTLQTMLKKAKDDVKKEEKRNDN